MTQERAEERWMLLLLFHMFLLKKSLWFRCKKNHFRQSETLQMRKSYAILIPSFLNGFFLSIRAFAQIFQQQLSTQASLAVFCGRKKG